MPVNEPHTVRTPEPDVVFMSESDALFLQSFPFASYLCKACRLYDDALDLFSGTGPDRIGKEPGRDEIDGQVEVMRDGFYIRVAGNALQGAVFGVDRVDPACVSAECILYDVVPHPGRIVGCPYYCNTFGSEEKIHVLQSLLAAFDFTCPEHGVCPGKGS